MSSVAFLWDVISRTRGAIWRTGHGSLERARSGGSGCFTTVRARPRRESCLFGDDVVDTTHLVWLVVTPNVGFCEHLRGRCGVFSVQGSYFFAACV